MEKIKKTPRLIAFYLPQYHPIPENDEWWGKGFTEWTNVAKAKPLFKGHYQPHIPADLGFYDLRLPETRQAQADLAREYGIHGFCYYHYWFNGKRLLEQPFQEVLESGEPDFPFCLCWANENWTRRWDGADHKILIRQVYSEQDDVEHIKYLLPIFEDPRYIKINGKPLILIYRIQSLPNARRTVEIWRKMADQAGFPGIYLCSVVSLSILHFDPTVLGFDAAVDFVPDWKYLPDPKKPLGYNYSIFRKIMKRAFPENIFLFNHISKYAAFMENMINRPEPNFKLFPGVTPGWDNSARKRKFAHIFYGSNPKLYGEWLKIAINLSRKRFINIEEQLVFINAWNEWGEGNHLEPDLKWGRAYLEKTRDVLYSLNKRSIN